MRAAIRRWFLGVYEAIHDFIFAESIKLRVARAQARMLERTVERLRTRNAALAREVERLRYTVGLLRRTTGSREDYRAHILCYPGPTRLHDVALVASPGMVTIYAYPETKMDERERDEFEEYIGQGTPLPLGFALCLRYDAVSL